MRLHVRVQHFREVSPCTQQDCQQMCSLGSKGGYAPHASHAKEVPKATVQRTADSEVMDWLVSLV